LIYFPQQSSHFIPEPQGHGWPFFGFVAFDFPPINITSYFIKTADFNKAVV